LKKVKEVAAVSGKIRRGQLNLKESRVVVSRKGEIGERRPTRTRLCRHGSKSKRTRGIPIRNVVLRDKESFAFRGGKVSRPGKLARLARRICRGGRSVSGDAEPTRQSHEGQSCLEKKRVPSSKGGESRARGVVSSQAQALSHAGTGKHTLLRTENIAETETKLREEKKIQKRESACPG